MTSMTNIPSLMVTAAQSVRRMSTEVRPIDWPAVRRRWEGDPRQGFAWVAREIEAAVGASPSRQALFKRAAAGGWTKGGPRSQPLRPAATAVVPAAPGANAGHQVSTTLPSRPTNGPANHSSLGRPTKYRSEYAQMLLDHFGGDAFTTVFVEKNGDQVPVKVPRVFPTLERFAGSIGVTTQTMRAWAAATEADGQPRHPEFVEALRQGRERQAALLIEGGLSGAFDAKIVAFALKNLSGWSDTGGPAEGTTPTVPLAELAERFMVVMDAAHARMAEVLAERAHLLQDEG
jgi:hypothetical protein